MEFAGRETGRQRRTGLQGERGELARAAALAPDMVAPDNERNHAGHHRRGDECMSDAAMVFELVDGPAEAPHHVEIGGFGSEHGGHSGQRGFAIEPGAANAGASKKVGDGFHIC